MIKGVNRIVVFSSNAQMLAAFYRDVVGLTLRKIAKKNKNKGIFEFKKRKSVALVIRDNSGLVANTKNSKRFMIVIGVDDIKKEVQHLKKNKARLVSDITRKSESGLVAVFEDIDGNHFQVTENPRK